MHKYLVTHTRLEHTYKDYKHCSANAVPASMEMPKYRKATRHGTLRVGAGGVVS